MRQAPGRAICVRTWRCSHRTIMADAAIEIPGTGSRLREKGVGNTVRIHSDRALLVSGSEQNAETPTAFGRRPV